MIPTTLTSRVGADGVLSVVVPLGPAEANREVRVTVEPVAEKAEMTPEHGPSGVRGCAPRREV